MQSRMLIKYQINNIVNLTNIYYTEYSQVWITWGLLTCSTAHDTYHCIIVHQSFSFFECCFQTYMSFPLRSWFTVDVQQAHNVFRWPSSARGLLWHVRAGRSPSFIIQEPIIGLQLCVSAALSGSISVPGSGHLWTWQPNTWQCY